MDQQLILWGLGYIFVAVGGFFGVKIAMAKIEQNVENNETARVKDNAEMSKRLDRIENLYFKERNQ